MAAAAELSATIGTPPASPITFATLPQLPGTDYSRCVLDAFRTACAVHLSRYLDINLELAYSGVDISKQKETDFTVAVPRFRIKGNPQDVVRKVVDNVRTIVVSICSCSPKPTLLSVG